jgi:hypothetical protein
MSYEPRLISPFVKSGLSQYFKPFIIGDTAFPDIQDAYGWRGSVRKREGYRLFTDAPLATTPVQGLKTWIDPFTLVPNSIAFSLTKSYGFLGGNYNTDITQLSDGATIFSFGNGAFDYYWTSNFQGSMWTTNGLGFTTAKLSAGIANGILYLTNNAQNSWNIFTPQLDATPTYLNGALIIMPYKGRLVALGPIEGNASGTTNVTRPNRARWGQLGNDYVPTYNKTGGTGPTSPPAAFAPGFANAWRSDIPGLGGFNDADTSEKIVSAAIINDTMIVGFQRSMWRLRYTGNEILPFVWERINTQYGCESTFSNVSFDKDAIFFSRYGWVSSTTNEVQRIDEEIPDQSFSFETGSASTFNNLNTVQGARDFFRQMAYWTFAPIKGADQQIFAYNYIDKSWSSFNPTNQINCFGEYFNTTDQAWPTLTQTWDSYNSPDQIWANLGSTQNQGFPLILGGDAVSGNIYQMFEFNAAPTSDNGTPFNFSITTKRFNPYFDSGQKCRMGYVDLYLTPNTFGEINFQHFIDDKPYPVFNRNVTLYSRGVQQISAIATGPITTITTIEAHNLNTGQQIVFSNVTGSIDSSINNQTVPVTVVDSFNFTVPLGTGGLTVTQPGYFWATPFNPGEVKYARVYLGGIGYHHQFVITLTENQMLDPIKSTAQFELQGLVIWTRPTGMIRG